MGRNIAVLGSSCGDWVCVFCFLLLCGYGLYVFCFVPFFDGGPCFRVVQFLGLHVDKSLTSITSVAGRHMLPLGVSSESRRTCVVLRVLSHTLTGHSPNYVFLPIMGDIVRASTEGVGGIVPYGQPVKIFPNPMAFYANYPEISEAANVMGHTADTFCPLCAISKNEEGS